MGEVFWHANVRFEPIRLQLKNGEYYKIQALSSGFTLIARETKEEPKEKPAQEPEKPRGKPKRETTTGDSQGKYLDICDLCAGRVGQLSVWQHA